MSAVYITEQGAVVHQSSRQLVVTKDKEKLLHIPLIKIDSLLLFGNVQLTTQAVKTLLKEGIDVAFLSQRGRLYGRLVPSGSRNIIIRMAQYERFHDYEFQLETARAIVKSKIRNGRAFILYYQKNHPQIDFSGELKTISQVLKKLDSKTTVNSLMGSEGIATATYFRAYGRMFTQELRFAVRTRRPPKDPVNALLSLGYTMLTNEIVSLISAHGMDPYIGFLHSIDYGRPSLALDIVEEFRHPFIDRFTLNLINKNILSKNDFRPVESKGVYLTEDALKKFFKQYSKRISEPMLLQDEDKKLTFRELIKRQVRSMIKTIKMKKPYNPFKMRW